MFRDGLMFWLRRHVTWRILIRLGMKLLKSMASLPFSKNIFQIQFGLFAILVGPWLDGLMDEWRVHSLINRSITLILTNDCYLESTIRCVERLWAGDRGLSERHQKIRILLN